MSTPNQQLLGMMSPDQARLLDAQLREQQIQSQAGGGLFSGAVAATLRGNDAIANAVRGRQVGANEQQNTEKRAALKAQQAALEAKQAAEQKTADELQRESNSILVERDIKKLEAIRDRLIERNTPEAAKSAKLAHEKIIRLRQELKESGGSSSLINKSGLPDTMKQSLIEEVTSGVTKPQDVPKRIAESNTKVAEQMERDSGINLIDGYGLSEAEAAKYKGMLDGGVPLSTIVSKIEPKTDELTNQNLITMYRFFTPESVDAYKEAVESGTKVTQMPKLVSLAKGQDGKIITGKPTITQAIALQATIEILADNIPVVEEYYETAGLFGTNVDKSKVIGTTAQIYALANSENISLEEAIIKYVNQAQRLAELEAKAQAGG